MSTDDDIFQDPELLKASETTDHPPLNRDEIAAWVEFYASEGGPVKFLHQRRRWLTDHDAVRLEQVGPDSFDIVVRVDGTYHGRDDAERMRTFIAEQLAAAMALVMEP